ncbi:MAG: FKBP-type peptidyl-prolyl cis-trans isomerase [Candidatus Saccharibacteria bacterium]|nr:FKBP-type peptidyl-prolyl cis-trans isomerase [Candidatus Saccharibacteria bacterium]
MATTRGQRWGIWIIAGTMLVGTIGGFIAMMVAPANEARDRAALEAVQKQYSEATAAYQKTVEQKATEYAARYYGQIASYTARVAAFDSAAVTELKKEDLKVGDGEEITAQSVFAAYYIGWSPKGEVFDQSIADEGGTLKTFLYQSSPAVPGLDQGLSKAALIQGWKQGMVGMKIGGVRELTVPASLAYGEAGSGDKIPANTPLKFIVMAVPKPADKPEIPELLKKEYKKYGIDV